jgi:hypothetical protein
MPLGQAPVVAGRRRPGSESWPRDGDLRPRLNTGPSILVLGVGGVVLFTAVADRCPIWQSIRPRLAALVGRSDPVSPAG